MEIKPSFLPLQDSTVRKTNAAHEDALHWRAVFESIFTKLRSDPTVVHNLYTTVMSKCSLRD